MNKIRFGRLSAILLLTVYSVYVIFGTKNKKETPFDRRVRQLETEIRDMAETDPVRKARQEDLAKVKSSKLTISQAQTQEAELVKELKITAQDSKEYSEITRKISVVRAQIPKWYDSFPLNLGLDLRGGTEVRLRIVSKKLEQKVIALNEDLRKVQAGTTAYSKINLELKVALEQLDKNIENAVDIIRSRLNRQGLAEIPVTKEGKNRIRVQLPGMDSETAKNIIDTIKTAGRLEFRLVLDRKENIRLFDDIDRIKPKPNSYNICISHGRSLQPDEIDAQGRCKLHHAKLYDWLEEPTQSAPDGSIKHAASMHLLMQEENPLTGDHIRFARTSPSASNPGRFQVNFKFDLYGTKVFGRLTSENINHKLAIILDHKLSCAPNIQSAITGGSGVITGNYTTQEADSLVVVLREGSLPVDIEVELENTVGPTLGEDSIGRGMQAIVSGLILMLIFMSIYYLSAGIITDLGLFLNMLFILAVLIGQRAALTLPGIAGLILTVGMAVDANVLIFERIREELKKGLSLSQAIENGYDRAFVTIVDANLTTLITAFILMGYGTDAVVGFGTMLTIGILTSMFVSLFVTRAFFHLLLDIGLLKNLKMMQIVKAPNINFVKLCRPVAACSLILIIFGMGVFIYRGERNLSHDLAGGTLAHINLNKEIDVKSARSRLKEMGKYGFSNISLQTYGLPGKSGYTSYVLRTRQVAPDQNEADSQQGKKTAAQFKTALSKTFPMVSDGITEISPTGNTISERPEWEFTLNLGTQLSPAEIKKILLSSELKNVNTRAYGLPRPEQKSTNAQLTLAIRKKDDKGIELTKPEQWQKYVSTAIGKLSQDFLSLKTSIGKPSLALATVPSPEEILITLPLTCTRPVKAEEVRKLLSGSDDFSSIKVKLIGLPLTQKFDPKPAARVTILCSVPLQDELGKTRKDQNAQQQFIRGQMSALKTAGLLNYTEPFSRFTSVGPMVASEMKKKAVLALIYSMVAIFFYIWLRFQFRAAFGLGACIALVHDVLFTLGAISIADEFFSIGIKIDLTIVAALLTIVGYSLNDTIVVFDRIRENISATGGALSDIINKSVNQTLSRTLLTSVTTLLVIVALLLWGGEVIRGFAYSLFVGVFIGTYSSIFIAAPMLVYMEDWAEKRKLKKAEQTA